MFYFGKSSKRNNEEIVIELKEVLEEAISLGLIDFGNVCGYRPREEQTAAFTDGKSKVQWPDSMHNVFPSMAADLQIYINGKATFERFHYCFLAGIIQTIALKRGHYVRWGGNWDGDGEIITDQTFQDLMHFEYRGKRHE